MDQDRREHPEEVSHAEDAGSRRSRLNLQTLSSKWQPIKYEAEVADAAPTSQDADDSAQKNVLAVSPTISAFTVEKPDIGPKSAPNHPIDVQMRQYDS